MRVRRLTKVSSPCILGLLVLGSPGHGPNASARSSSEVRFDGSAEKATYQGGESLIAYQLSYHGEVPTSIEIFNFRTSQVVPAPNLNRECALPGAPALSASKRFIAFDDYSTSDGFCFTLGSRNIFLYDLLTSTRVSLPGLNTASTERQPSLSGSGRFVAFESDRTGSFDVFLYDRETRSLVPTPGLNSTFSERSASIGGDAGRFIAFESNRSGTDDIFLYDRALSSLIRLRGLNTGFRENSPALSGDGRFIAFSSNRRGGHEDILLYDQHTASLVPLPGLNSTPAGTLYGIADDSHPSISGSYIAFQSDRESDHGGHPDVYFYNRATASLVKTPRSGLDDYWEPSIR